MTYKNLKEQRAELIKSADALLEKKDFSDSDASKVSDMQDQIREITRQMDKLTLKDLKSDVRVGAARDGSDAPLTIGDRMAGMFKKANDREVTAREQRAMDSANDGQVIDEDAQSSEVLELVRANSVAFQAGVRTVSMPAGAKYSIPKLTGSITPAWRAENAALADSDAGFGSIELTWKSLAASTTISNELLADSAVPLAQILSSEASKAFGLKIDQDILLSDGSANSITGIAAQVGLTNIDVAPSAFASYASLISAIRTVKGQNFTPSAILTGTDVEGVMAGLTASDNQPLMAPSYVTLIPWLTTTTLEGDDIAFVGDFTRSIFAVREGLEIRMNPYIKSANNQTVMEMIMRCDFKVTHLPAFVKIEDVA